MKWIGQHIYDYISRFRNDVYLEDVATGTIVSGGHLGLDSNNKIVKAVDGGGDLTGITAGVGLSGSSLTGPVPTLTVDFSEFSAVTPTNGDSLATLDSDGANEQLTTVAALATLFAGTGLTASNSVIGVDAAQTQITSVGTIGTGVWQGTAINQTYLVGQSGTNTGDETRSSIEGLAITSVGTIAEGTWQGTAVASAYLDADTAHLSEEQTFTGTKTLNSFKGTGSTTVTTILDEDTMASDSATALATQQSIKAYADRPTKQLKIYHANFKGSARTTETFIPLAGVPDEHTDGSKEQTAIIMPCAGVVKEIILRMHWTSTITTSDNITWRVYNRTKNLKMNAETIIGSPFEMVNPTQGSNDDNNTRTSGEISYGFAEYDAIAISMQWDNTGPTNSGDRMYVTVVTELDVSGIGY